MLSERNIPKLTLVGAGPGDAELITLKAINALRDADVVLYDALACPSLLAYCHPLCEKIYVGKKGHLESISQDTINFLIVEKAYEKGHVVRLKGGDPFVFGRGMEEIKYAKSNGLEVAYIPGISSVFSAGNHLIPLTDRNYSDGFWVITGHKSDLSFSEDLKLAAQSKSTVVFLMAMTKINYIQSFYCSFEKHDMPFCIIQNAYTSNEKIVVGKMKDLGKLAEEHKMSNPAIILVGEVVNYYEILKDIVNQKSLELI
jgi:uroporphyrin-III C-methyltransferase